MLTVTLSRSYRAEQIYILNVLLREFLGLDFQVMSSPNARHVVALELGGKTLSLPQTLFGGDGVHSLDQRYPPPVVRKMSLSRSGVPARTIVDDHLPVLFGALLGQSWVSRTESDLTLYADVLGSSFFMLTRLEEIGVSELNEFGLFPAGSTLAAREGFLMRPIVDEYAELLWQLIHELWPDLKRKVQRFAVHTSHDVDRPNAYDYPSLRDRMWAVRDHARKGILPPLLGSHVLNGSAAVLSLKHVDPFDNFDWLMDVDERAGMTATFFFLAGGKSSFDARYEIRSSPLRRILRRVADRGHAIGLHGSYWTIDDATLLRREAQTLSEVLEAENIAQVVTTCRQHYLRWRAPDTWRAACAAGLAVDCSVGFNEVVGFRCGTSREFPVFDVPARSQLALRERPLLVMDRALWDLTDNACVATIGLMRHQVARYGGALEVLWHNNVFAERPAEYARYLAAISSGG